MFALTIDQPSKTAIRLRIDETITKAKSNTDGDGKNPPEGEIEKQSIKKEGKPKTPVNPQEEEVVTPVKRQKGRPKKTVRERKITLMDKPSEYVNYDTTHKELDNYKYLRNQIFTDPNTGRPYVVIVICYDKKAKEPVAYRRNLDDLPADPFDDFPFKVIGNRGIEALVKEYSMNGTNNTYEEVTNCKWPSSEQEMLDIQKKDIYWGPLIAKLLDDNAKEGIPWRSREIKLNNDRTTHLKAVTDDKIGALRIRDNRSTHSHERVILPTSLQRSAILMYHDQHGHPSTTRTASTLRNTYTGSTWTATSKHT